MNKQTISSTAVCYWSKEDDCYLMHSPLCEGVLGVGDTVEEVKQTFNDLLSDAYEAYLEGRIPGYDRPGRPAKGSVSFDTNVLPSTKESIKEIAANIDCSMGEVIDYLVFQYKHLPPIEVGYSNYDRVPMVSEKKTRYKLRTPFNSEQLVFLQNMLQKEFSKLQKGGQPTKRQLSIRKTKVR